VRQSDDQQPAADQKQTEDLSPSVPSEKPVEVPVDKNLHDEHDSINQTRDQRIRPLQTHGKAEIARRQYQTR